MREFIDTFVSKTFGKNGSLTKGQVLNLSQRERLSDFLPYLYYDENAKAFLNTDNTWGYCYECAPLSFYNPKAMKRITKLLEMNFPARTVIQVSLIADKHIKPVLDEYVKCKTRDSVMAKKTATEYANHLLSGVDHFPQTGIPVRNFKILFSIKTPELLREDQITLIEESLKSSHLFSHRMNGNDLTVYLRRFLNGKENKTVSDNLSPTKPIRKQILESDTLISFPKSKPVRIGNKYAACLTQLTCPEETSILEENELTGGYMGLIDDGNQFLSPFISTYTITFDDADSEVAGKSKIMIGQQVVGKNAIELNKRIGEINWISKLDESKTAKVQYSLWIYADSEQELSESVSRAKRIASEKDYTLQEETLLKTILFISSLPFGFYHIKGNVEQIDRYTILPAESIAAILPLQADYSGTFRMVNGKIPEGQRPILLNVGRKG